LVDARGSIETLAAALGIGVAELEDWLGGMEQIPHEYHAAIRALTTKLKEKK
jgi:hypothetical protein